jgi:integrase
MKKMGKLSISTQNSLKSAFKHINKYADMIYKDIKAFHMQDTIDNCGKSYSTQAHIKSLWNHMDKLALEMDVINKCYSDLLTSAPVPETTRTRFTAEEIERLWNLYENEDFELADIILIFIYSGFRISELLNMKTEDVNLEEGYFKGGVKTKAGKNRIVPIHSLIRPMVEKRVNEGNEYLISMRDKNKGYNLRTFRNRWGEIMEYLKMDKTPHECRHTFESMLDSAGANRRCIDLMMGHTSKDTGNRVYNHKTIEELKTNIELVTR